MPAEYIFHRQIGTFVKGRMGVCISIIIMLFVGLTGRIMYINSDHGEAYKKKVYSQQKYDSTTLPYRRGDIVDRKGSKLAYSERVYNLVIDSKLMQEDDRKYFDDTVEALRKCFPQLDIAEMKKYVEQNPTSQYRVFLRKLSYDERQTYLDYEEKIKQEDKDKKQKRKLLGVWFEEDYKRIYPYASMACDLIGFLKKDDEGNCGLEEYYNTTLRGINGRKYGYLTEDNILEKNIKPPIDGQTLVTSIDTNIQSIVEKHILEFNEEHRNEVRPGNGAKNIGCIIMNPNNGEILAMASYPTFDLNNPRDLTQFYTEEELAEMDEDEKSEALNQIWKNFCISDTYEPGSTAKPFTVAGAIEDGSITGNETFGCSGALDVGGHTIHCHNRLGDGLLTVTQGIQKSCNVVLMDVAFAMGKEEWLKYNRLMNFGLKTNIDLAGEVNAQSLVFGDNMGQTDLAVGSFGQGFNVTMIQIASAYAALINGGYYYQPHVVTKIQNSMGAVIDEIEPRVVRQVISNSTSEKIRSMLRAVVMEGKEGTGYTARPYGYSMGGKTGTAEKIPRDKKNYLVSFCGYAPEEDPQVLCYVVVDQPNTAPQDNARYATVLTKKIMTEVLPYMNIFMTEPLTDEEREELSEMQIGFSENSGTVSRNNIQIDPQTGEHYMVSENEAAGDGAGETTAASDTDEGTESAEPDESVPGVSVNEIRYDPNTGYPIDPNTGEILDPETLLPVSGSTSFMN